MALWEGLSHRFLLPRMQFSPKTSRVGRDRQTRRGHFVSVSVLTPSLSVSKLTVLDSSQDRHNAFSLRFGLPRSPNVSKSWR